MNKSTIKRKLFHTAAWQVTKRAAKSLPFGGALIVAGLWTFDVKRKGLVGGTVNSALDAVPFVGLAKNAIELFTGDLIADREKGEQVVKQEKK